jgi:paraquat-inducible protein B
MAAIRPAAVGGFILGALALGIAAILFFGSSRLFSQTTSLVVFFNGSLAGLDVGAPVTFRGVRIGAVQRIALRFSPGTVTARTPVFLELDADRVSWEGGKRPTAGPDIQRLVEAGLRAQLALESLVTGQLRVDLDFRPDTPAELVGAIPDVSEVPALPSELDQLRNQLTGLPLRELVATARQTLSSLNRLSDHLDAKLDPLVASAQRTADSATETLKTANDSVRRLQTDASDTLQQLDALVTDARRQLDGRGDELAHTLAAAERTARQADALLASLNSLAAPRSQFRGDLEATMRDLAASASSLRTFAHAVERDPSALLTGRSR